MSDNIWLYKLTMKNTLDNNFLSCQAGGRGFESRLSRTFQIIYDNFLPFSEETKSPVFNPFKW